ncbi:PPE domain-containing protein [Nocardia sp. CA-129566]|uniref:PPE domain-containing protein n=1 Tax=Nocardia sp. CA-129566 TaxID=3239976 RepID=UPI003D991114
MLLPFFIAQTPEEIIGRLLGGPGVTWTQVTASAYWAMAAELNAAAAATEGSMTELSGTWHGLSAEQAQAAFRNHAGWLRAQAVVAEQTGQVADLVATIYSGAQSAMEVVAAHLVEFRVTEAALVATTAMGAPTGPLLAAHETEYLEIKAEATAVMVGYAAALIPVLAALPPPIEAPPIVTGGDPGMQMDYTTYDDPTYTGSTDHTGTNPTQTSTPSTSSDTGGGNQSNGGGNQSNGGGDNGSNGGGDNGPTDPTQPTDPTNPAGTSDPEQLTPQMDPSAVGGDSGANGYDFGSSDQQGLTGTSQYSTTLAGLNGGVGSLVALNMARGGLGSMPGASTGFRMPANWNLGAARAFGAVPQQPGLGSMGPRQGPPRGAVAPKSRMRRRRDDEKKPSKVFVPGEPQEVPVLEKAPVVGVIEYADGNGRDEPVLEPVLAVGVIERVEDEAVLASAERPR